KAPCPRARRLPDRGGAGGDGGVAGGKGRARAGLRHAGRRAGRRARGRAGRAGRGGGGAVFPRLRQFRPVQEFRGTRGGLRQAGGGASRRKEEKGMIATSSRTDRSVVGRWWRSVDRWALGALLALALAGLVLVGAASPSVAERI